jgi:hypothetical protein
MAEFAARHPGLEVHLVLSDAGLEVGQDRSTAPTIRP